MFSNWSLLRCTVGKHIRPNLTPLGHSQLYEVKTSQLYEVKTFDENFIKKQNWVKGKMNGSIKQRRISD